MALLLYSLVGSLGVITVPLVQMALDRLEGNPAQSAKEEASDVEATPPPRGLPSDDLGLDFHEGPGRQMKRLAVDDDPFILELIPLISGTAGFSAVTTVSSGKLALEALAGRDTVFDCLLLDINMPGLDGIALCARVREMPHYRHTPIIMLTAMRDMKYLDGAFAAGATDYVTKPFEISDLAAHLQFAQESIVARQRLAASYSAKDTQIADIAPRHTFALSESVGIRGIESLADHTAAGNYLTQLPLAQLTATQVVAVKIDQIERIYTRATTPQFIRALQDVADAIQSNLDNRIMTYSGDGTFLVISDIMPLNPAILEADIRDHLVRRSLEGEAVNLREINVSVGNPVIPVETKAKRSEITFDRAIIRAENRFCDKHAEVGGRVARNL